MQYMLKWPDLYLSNSAYLAKYMDPALVSFMDSSRGIGRVLYASDHPFLPMERAAGGRAGPPALRPSGRRLHGRHGAAAPQLAAVPPDGLRPAESA